jgi:hypothetical protein
MIVRLEQFTVSVVIELIHWRGTPLKLTFISPLKPF